jgi:pimeloyl-ACP methyl ester carboxylesterase
MQTILVSHGALGSAEQMQPIVDALTAFGEGRIHVVALEFPGHGRTPLPGDRAFGIPHFVEAMAQAVGELRGPPPLLFGYSMGGYVGLALEARSPNTFSGVVTLGTKFVWTPSGAEREAARLDPVALELKVPKFAAQLAARHEHAGGWETMMVRTAALLRENGSAPLLTVQALERIAIPVCVAVGTKDETVGVAESQAAADVMLCGRCEVLEDVPHPIERVPVQRIVDLLRPMLKPSAS